MWSSFVRNLPVGGLGMLEMDLDANAGDERPAAHEIEREARAIASRHSVRKAVARKHDKCGFGDGSLKRR